MSAFIDSCDPEAVLDDMESNAGTGYLFFRYPSWWHGQLPFVLLDISEPPPWEGK